MELSNETQIIAANQKEINLMSKVGAVYKYLPEEAKQKHAVCLCLASEGKNLYPTSNFSGRNDIINKLCFALVFSSK